MDNSIFEQEIGRLIKGVGTKFRTHDRGVLVGFIFSLLPIFPVVFLGLGIGIFHVAMHRAGRLSNHDYRLARRGLFLATFNCLLSLLLVWSVMHVMSRVQWDYIGGHLADQLRQIFSTLFSRAMPIFNRNGVVV